MNFPYTNLNFNELQRCTLRRGACWQAHFSTGRICSSNNYVLSQHSLKILHQTVIMGPFKKPLINDDYVSTIRCETFPYCS